MNDLTWRVGTAPSLDGPEVYVVLQLSETEVALDYGVAQKIAEALYHEAHNVEMKMLNGPTPSRLILPPGVRVATTAPPETTHVPCVKCGQPIELAVATFEAMKKDASGRAFDLEHETCPETEAAPAHTYYIEIVIHRDPPAPPTLPVAQTVAAWFVAEHAADSFVVALPVLNERLMLFWQKVQENITVIDQIADANDANGP